MRKDKEDSVLNLGVEFARFQVSGFLNWGEGSVIGCFSAVGNGEALLGVEVAMFVGFKMSGFDVSSPCEVRIWVAVRKLTKEVEFDDFAEITFVLFGRIEDVFLGFNFGFEMRTDRVGVVNDFLKSLVFWQRLQEDFADSGVMFDGF